MMVTIQRSLLVGGVLLLFLTLGVGAGSPVLAAPGNGALHISDSNCHDDDGYTACMTAEGVANETITPSGNAIYSGSVRTTFSLINPAGALVYTGDSQSQFNRLDKDAMLHMLSSHATSTLTRSDGVTCTFTYSAHLANGQIQFDHTETECQ